MSQYKSLVTCTKWKSVHISIVNIKHLVTCTKWEFIVMFSVTDISCLK